MNSRPPMRAYACVHVDNVLFPLDNFLLFAYCAECMQTITFGLCNREE
jgi:hypothetical protein